MRHVVLFGPPNAGKTTLFNLLTGSKQSVVNYPGATVDIGIGSLVVPKRRKMAEVSSQVRVLDVPGVLSFVPQSEDERLSMQAISGLDQVISGAHATPDLIICVMDATQRSRHLAMTKRLIDDGYPVMVVITMIDEAKAKGIVINHVALSKELGVSVFAINARKPTNIDAIIDGVSINSVPCGRFINPKPFHLNDMVAAYAWADKVIKTCETVVSARKPMDLDKMLLHPIWGYVVFFGVMAAFFNVLYIVAAPMMDVIDTSFGALSEWVMGAGAPSWWRAFIAEGLISGLGGVLVFVPQIALLFFGMGVLESSGYLARSAALIDKPLTKVGLNGRSFLPLLSGCACAIPAILATRTIANRRVRLLTMAVIPLMQCAARLPVYGLLLGLLFTSTWHSAMALTGIYMGSIVLAGVISGVLARYVPQQESDHFLMALPAWRTPVWGQLCKQVGIRTWRFIEGAGPIIVVITICLWGISTFPSPEHSLLTMFGQWVAPIFAPMGVDWRVGVAIILSFAAREVFVSALAVVFNIADADISQVSDIASVTFESTGLPIFTTGSIVGLILFFMVAMQCGATLAVVKKETRSYVLPVLQLVGYIVLAYGLAVFANWVI